ncbi:hypothetical protein ACIA8K_16425 [Catenuloplanes sp. NPDC051500]|uniref:hypothetical protein n=1 Tax=Catenuloplanes sp. NPDC051500 TaxID=3363959 RepID=UPI0037B86DEE
MTRPSIVESPDADGSPMNEAGPTDAHDRELLWGMYTDVRSHSRHAESLRSSAVNFVLVAASVLIAVVFSDQRVGAGDLPAGLAIVLVGGFGTAFAASYTELYHRNRRRAEVFRAALDGSGLVEELLRASDREHERTRLHRWGRRATGSTHAFWLSLPALVALAGLILSGLALR